MNSRVDNISRFGMGHWAAGIVGETIAAAYAAQGIEADTPELSHLKYAQQEFWMNLLADNQEKARTWRRLVKKSMEIHAAQRDIAEAADRLVLDNLMREVSSRLDRSPTLAREHFRMLFDAASLISSERPAA